MECLARLRFASFRVRDASLELDGRRRRVPGRAAFDGTSRMPRRMICAVDGVRDGLETALEARLGGGTSPCCQGELGGVGGDARALGGELAAKDDHNPRCGAGEGLDEIEARALVGGRGALLRGWTRLLPRAAEEGCERRRGESPL